MTRVERDFAIGDGQDVLELSFLITPTTELVVPVGESVKDGQDELPPAPDCNATQGIPDVARLVKSCICSGVKEMCTGRVRSSLSIKAEFYRPALDPTEVAGRTLCHPLQRKKKTNATVVRFEFPEIVCPVLCSLVNLKRTNGSSVLIVSIGIGSIQGSISSGCTTIQEHRQNVNHGKPLSVVIVYNGHRYSFIVQFNVDVSFSRLCIRLLAQTTSNWGEDAESLS
ncbi:unnamed protein product [Somion occarium]|uniref:Uncharacterized protein n=1 Tax=Somion occarium TaxID=3059160 RepID=A0ABP1DS37_9APHY